MPTDTARHYAAAEQLSRHAQRLDLAGDEAEATHVWKQAGKAARLADRGESGDRGSRGEQAVSPGRGGWLETELAMLLGIPATRIQSWRLRGVYSEDSPGTRLKLDYRSDSHRRVVVTREDLCDFIGALESECHSVLGGLPPQANRWIRDHL